MASVEELHGLKDIPLLGGPLTIEGALGLETGDGWVLPWRLPPEDLELHHPGLLRMASFPAGVRLRFAGSACVVRLETEHVIPEGPSAPIPSRYDLLIDGERIASADVEPGRSGPKTIHFEDLPAGDKVIEVWLPLSPLVRVHRLQVDQSARVRPAPDNRPRWITYGSSITHGMQAVHPTGTWPAVAAQELGWHLTNMGYSGMCHFDPYVARAIARLPADYITLKLGINIHNLGTMRERTFAPMVHGFLATVREGHPTTPITIISPIISPVREDSPISEFNLPTFQFRVEGDLTIKKMRTILEEIVALRRRRGDAGLTYLDGRLLLGEAETGLLPDGLHPNAEGYALMGKRFAAQVGQHAVLTTA